MGSKAFLTVIALVVPTHTQRLVTSRTTEMQSDTVELINGVQTLAKDSAANCQSDSQHRIDKLVDTLVRRSLKVSAISRTRGELYTPSFETPKPCAWSGALAGRKYSPVIRPARSGNLFSHQIRSGRREHLRADQTFLRRHVGGVRTALQRDSSMNVRATPEAEIAEGTIKTLERQAPLLEDVGLLSKQVSYSCPLAYRYTIGVDAVAAPVEGTFSNKMPGDAFIALMDQVRSRLRDFPDSNLTLIRNFRPEPNVVISRWRVTFGRASIFGSSTYRLKDGKVFSIAENWETEKGDGSIFGNSLPFQLARRPIGQPKYSNGGFVPGYKFAIWEAVKSEKSFPSDQILREDVDGLSPKVLYTLLGMVSIDVFLIVAKIIKAIIQ